MRKIWTRSKGLAPWVAVILSTTGLPGCGDEDEDDVPPAPVATAQAEPSPSPQPRPSTTAQPIWARVYLRDLDDTIDPETCDQPTRFRVWSDGQFRAGPCVIGTASRTGRITSGERAELSRRASTVLDSAPSRSPECEPSAATVDRLLQLTSRRTGRTYDVFRVSLVDGTVCYRGGRENVEALLEYTVGLRDRYYPSRPAPSPSPSPTITVSPTPTPTSTTTTTATATVPE